MKSSRELVWMDGTHSSEVPGLLLSDNIGYYGECALTGVTYTYEQPLCGRGDTPQDVPDFIGRRLLDGNVTGQYGKTPAEVDGGVLRVVFDFQAPRRFTEVDFFCPSQVEEAEAALSADGKSFTSVGKWPVLGAFCRCPLQGAEGRYLRLILRGEDRLRLFQVWAWGDPLEDAAQAAQEGNPHFQYANSIASESLPGIPQTAFSDVEGFLWRRKLRRSGLGELDAAWSEQPAYGNTALAPILPQPEVINAPVYRRVCRGGVEVVCLALTNTDTDCPRDLTIALENPSPLRAELSVCGTLPSRWYGTQPGPLFNEENRIARPLMHRYLTNAPVIADFPLLHLPAGGSCLVWLKIYGGDAQPGAYALTLHAGNTAVCITAEVLPVALPAPHTGILLWSNGTQMLPFSYADRPQREAAYRNELGVNVYHGWPEKGTVAAEALRTNPRAQFMAGNLGKYGDLIYCNRLHPEDIGQQVRDDLREILDRHVRKAESLGLGFDQWYLEAPDEPGASNARVLGEVLKICKELDPRIRIYVNPAFWTGFENGAVSDDTTICSCLEGWYDLVDISMPLVLNLLDRPGAMRYFHTNREFNGQYLVAGQHMGAGRPALLQLGRACAWDSLSRGMNWWGFYSYHAPRLNTWDNRMCAGTDVDGTINYQALYAGVNGPVPTRASELIREGYQDYCIMALLEKKNPVLAAELKEVYLENLYDTDMEALKNRALDALLAD